MEIVYSKPKSAACLNSSMRKIRLTNWIILFLASTAFSQSDEEILENVRANAAKAYLKQASFTLPESFHKSGLAHSDKERLIGQWANASADCLVGALAKYAEATDVPLSDMVNSDGSFGLKGDGSSSEFHATLNLCIERAWEVAGASHEYN